MDDKEKKSLSVYLIALSVILSNLVILSVIYQVPFLSDLPAIRKAIPLLSLAAVYPYDLFRSYFREDLIIHFFWIMSLIISGFGLLLFNRFSRTVFIVFNIIHFVLLGVISAINLGQPNFWGYFFKCYFNLVAFLLYVGYLTLPEIREQFLGPTRERRFDLWFLKIRRKTLGQSDAAGYFNLGLAYQKLGRTEEALDFLTRATSIVSDKPEYHFALGNILFEQREYASAIKSFQQTIRFDPVHVRGRYFLALAYEKTGCLEEAVQSFRRCSFLEDKNSEIFRHLGVACYNTGHWEEAEQSFTKGSELDPQDYMCWFYLGLIRVKDKQRVKMAEECFKKALRIKPHFSDGYKEMGNLYVGQGDYKAAVRAFRDVLRLNESDTQAHYQLGFAYAMLKDIDSARREYKYLKDVDPDLAQTLSILLSRS